VDVAPTLLRAISFDRLHHASKLTSFRDLKKSQQVIAASCQLMETSKARGMLDSQSSCESEHVIHAQ
jgi:hypothetical protein